MPNPKKNLPSLRSSLINPLRGLETGLSKEESSFILKKVRSLNATDHPLEALLAAKALNPHAPSTLLEQAHALNASGKFEWVEKHLQRIFTTLPMPLLYLYQAAKHTAQAEMMRGDFKKAQLYANRAIEYAYLNYKTDQKVSAKILLSQIYIYQARFPEAQMLLTEISEENEALEFSEQSTLYHYVLSHYFYLQGNPNCLRSNEQVWLLSKKLKSPVMQYKCTLERMLMQKGNGCHTAEAVQECRKFAQESESNLIDWMSAILDKGLPNNAVLKVLLK